MEIYVPDYYKKFKCLAEKCRHTCCRGWEIDIDEETYSLYMKEEGALGKKLRENIFTDEEGAHFRLGDEERCPFLNQENLCDIIAEKGEGGLCQICRDHPRYRNFLESRTEMGMGLSCEGAASLILKEEGRPLMVPLTKEIDPTEEEKEFFRFRDEILDVIYGGKPIMEAMEELEEAMGISAPLPDYEFYISLSVLNDEWKEKLSELKENKIYGGTDSMARNLFSYFLYRHLADMYFDCREDGAVAFCIYAVKTVLCLAKTEESFIEIARQYSEEIEYNAENVERIIKMLEN